MVCSMACLSFAGGVDAGARGADDARIPARAQRSVSGSVNLASIRAPRPIAAAALKISLLGRLRIVRAGRAVDLQSKKAQALLGDPHLPPRRRPARAHLAALLGGGMGDEQARHNLRQCLSVLRRALGDRAVVGEGDRIYLDADVVHVDVATLDRTDGESATGVVDGELLEGLSVGEEAFD